MNRILAKPRPNWQARVEQHGFLYHTTEQGQPYWDESAYYHFAPAEIDVLEKSTYELSEMCLAVVEQVVKRGSFADFGIPPMYHDWLRRSWDTDELTIYSRFDLLYDGKNPPKMLEYNADTPTALLEAAVVQWYWKQEVGLPGDQFNSIHERLIEAWRRVKDAGIPAVAFASIGGHTEDYITANYMQDVAMQAGLTTQYLPLQQIGWNPARGGFVDLQDRSLPGLFKLYPWEWMLREQFARFLPQGRTRWYEPPWKMLLSNKALLAWLWKMFPDHPNLLEASAEPLQGPYVRKPVLGREGANITIVKDGQVVERTPGDYVEGPFVHQAYWPTPRWHGKTAVLGSWMVNGYACGIGMREDEGAITTNTSRFVPHLFDAAGSRGGSEAGIRADVGRYRG